jgi:hypothetical protein
MPRKEYRDRYTSVYFSSPEEMAKWEAKAKEYGVTLPRMIGEALNGLDNQAKPRPDLIQKVSALEDEVTRLRNELRLKSVLIEKYEADLFRLQNAGFAELDPEDGARRYCQKLIALLKDGKIHDSEDIFSGLNIDPRDSEACRLVQNQLLSLERHGLIAETAMGWKWLV